MNDRFVFLLKKGIKRDSAHKCRATDGKRKSLRKKRKFELGHPAANTSRIHSVRTHGGNFKLRALRLKTGNFAWASEGNVRKTRIADVAYNASNNELVRTKTLVKNSTVVIDAPPFRQWYEGQYVLPLGRKRNPKHAQRKKRSDKVMKKCLERQKYTKVKQALEDQFTAGRILACISSRPGQCGRSDDYILEGKKLEFYIKKIKSKKQIIKDDK